ncbi:ABC transporter substrate-binding protein [Pseudomonas sp. HR96]|uniref:ABC transporter substrate-binding protein n=1 Tax=Pseudomonas sp. HR96 TaxID=1027966 RepID=UPI002A7490A8|nr:ABC transporter substrate-binding protein [Pseudomonas sp. HR96]WPO97563.1 ABC transporter substrate-binding protein [Pseudomonas sp. HR96]
MDFFTRTVVAFSLGLGLVLAQPGLSMAASTLNIGVSDISTGNLPAGGGLVDVIRNQQRLENALAGQGVQVQWHFFKGAAPLINEALASGTLDMAYLGDLGALVGRAGGLDTRVVAVAARGVSHYLAVPPGSDIHTMADLKGRTVGLLRGTAAQLSFIGALQTAGLRERDVKVINLDFAAASAALAARQIDATWGGAGELALRDRGQAQIAVSTRALGGAGELAGLVVVSGRLLTEHPDWVQAIVQVQRDAATWASAPEHYDAYLTLLATQAAYPVALLKEDLQGAPPLAQLLSPQLDPAFVSHLAQAAAQAKTAGLIRGDVAIDAWLAPQLLQASTP